MNPESEHEPGAQASYEPMILCKFYCRDKGAGFVHLAQVVKEVVDDKAKYTDWSQRDDIKAELKVDLIIALAENGYPPVDRDEVYKEIFEQAENFKRYLQVAG